MGQDDLNLGQAPGRLDAGIRTPRQEFEVGHIQNLAKKLLSCDQLRVYGFLRVFAGGFVRAVRAGSVSGATLRRLKTGELLRWREGEWQMAQVCNAKLQGH